MDSVFSLKKQEAKKNPREQGRQEKDSGQPAVPGGKK